MKEIVRVILNTGFLLFFITSIPVKTYAGNPIAHSKKNERISKTDSNQQQSRTVKGTILDESGEAIIGASIIEKGASGHGTISDVNGNFMLRVGENATLQVSYVGYVSQDVGIPDTNEITITLQKDDQLLDEVVVIGYGTVKRKDFTGSVSSVKLENSPVILSPKLNLLEALKGSVAGLNMGAVNKAGEGPSDLLVRGQNSINGSNSPLIVLDGVIFLGSIRDINPNDIASVDVLKDATSSAAYGSRSANGVIAITTKRGVEGKPQITFNTKLAAQSWQGKPELMKGEQWLASVNGRNGYEVGATNWITKGELINRENGVETDWLDVISRTGFVQDYQLAVSGASTKANYYVSGAYSNNKGIIIGDDFDRISLLGKLKTNITDWLEISLDAAYSRVDYSGQAANYAMAFNVPPYGVQYRDEEKTLMEKYPAELSITNPLWGVNDGTRTNEDIRDNYRLGGYVLVTAPWVKGLTYRFNYMGNREQRRTANFTNERNFVKEGSYDDPSRYSPTTYETFLSSATGSIEDIKVDSYVIDNIVNYFQAFQQHEVDITLVATRDLRLQKNLNSTGKDYQENGNTALGVYGLSKASVKEITQTNNRRANIGYLARASYSFDHTYYITGSYRRDGASVFGTNRKWADFGALGFAWRITKENFMENVKPLNDLKLKFSWGQNGNQGIDPYATLATVVNAKAAGLMYQFSDTKDKVYYGLYQNVLGNSNLGWEKTSAFNVGFESSWFDNRLIVDLDLYKSETTDQLFTRNIPVMSGFKSIKTSMGQVDNKGIELTVRSVNIQNKNWRWTTGLTCWKNNNKLVRLYGDDLDGDGREDDDISNKLFIGKSLGVIYGYKQIGMVQEEDTEYMELTGAKPGTPKYEDIDGTPGISATDRQILGYSKENFRLNISNTVRFKDLELYMMLTGTFGGNNMYLAENKSAYVTPTGRFNANGIYIEHWTPENRSNEFPRIDFTDDGRFLGLQNRGFVRIQDVILSYTFNQSWIKKSFVKSLRVFCSGQNLAIFTNWDHGDPETGATLRGSEFPVATTYSFGATLGF